jgi:hypothetical protein
MTARPRSSRHGQVPAPHGRPRRDRAGRGHAGLLAGLRPAHGGDSLSLIRAQHIHWTRAGARRVGLTGAARLQALNDPNPVEASRRTMEQACSTRAVPSFASIIGRHSSGFPI